MEIEVTKCTLDEVKALRILFLHENHFQFVHDKCHYYGWADTYVFRVDGVRAGYGSVWGRAKRDDRDAIFEFFVLKNYRNYSDTLYREFLSISAVTHMECQTNDILLTEMMYRYAENIEAEAVLFEDSHQTNLMIPNTVLKRNLEGQDNPSCVGGYFLEHDGKEVATGGFMLNYNMPYADIYMDVQEQDRRKGFGSLIIQELKKEIYLKGRVPAARCNINNLPSKGSLTRAGFKVCGFLLNGKIKTEKTEHKGS